MNVFVPRFDLVVFLWLPADLRLARLRERERARYGDAVAPGGPRRATYEAFIAWAARYDDGDPVERSRAMHEQWLATLPCPVMRLDGAMPIDANVAAIVETLTGEAR